MTVDVSDLPRQAVSSCTGRGVGKAVHRCGALAGQGSAFMRGQGRPGTPPSLAKKCFKIHYINAIFAMDRVVLALSCDKIKCSAGSLSVPCYRGLVLCERDQWI